MVMKLMGTATKIIGIIIGIIVIVIGIAILMGSVQVSASFAGWYIILAIVFFVVGAIVIWLRVRSGKKKRI